MNDDTLRSHFEQNMLDGDPVQANGQMLNASFVLEYIEELMQDHNKALQDRLLAALDDFDYPHMGSGPLVDLDQIRAAIKTTLGIENLNKGEK